MRLLARSGHPQQNQLLRALPASDYRRLLPDLQEVSLPSGHVLFEARERIAHVYFPQQCVVSLLAVVEGEPGVEIAIVGNEGMVGLSVFLGVANTASRAVSQVPDGAHRLTVAAFRRALTRGPALRQILLRYTDTLMTQIAQSAACNQRHSVEQRCARWLLMAHDRVGSNRFLLTQEFLGQMLDVQRPTVSAAARHLHGTGAIDYTRGRITVVSRARLEQGACACYHGDGRH